MAGLSNYTEAALLNWFYKGTAVTFNTGGNKYVRLYSANPDFETGSGGTEMVGTNYTAGGIALADGSNGANWTVSTQGSYGGYKMQNNNAVTWTAGSDWPAITGVAVWDNSSGGNMLWGGAFSGDPGNGDTVRVNTNALTVNLDTITDKHGVTSYVKQKMLQKLSGDGTFTPPASMYVALFTVTPDLVAPTLANEVSGSGTAYTRASIAQAGWNTASGAAPILDNTAQIDYTLATANWGTVTAAALVDSGPASGTAVTNWYAVKGGLSLLMDSGDDFYIAAGAFDIGLD